MRTIVKMKSTHIQKRPLVLRYTNYQMLSMYTSESWRGSNDVSTNGLNFLSERNGASDSWTDGIKDISTMSAWLAESLSSQRTSI